MYQSNTLRLSLYVRTYIDFADTEVVSAISFNFMRSTDMEFVLPTTLHCFVYTRKVTMYFTISIECVSIKDFPNHVVNLHSSKNQGFMEEYFVSKLPYHVLCI